MDGVRRRQHKNKVRKPVENFYSFIHPPPPHRTEKEKEANLQMPIISKFPFKQMCSSFMFVFTLREFGDV